MGQQFTDKLHQGHRGPPQELLALPHRRRLEHAERITRTHPSSSPASTTSLPPAACAAAASPVGDLDLLVTGPACEPDVVAAAVEHVAALPLIDKLLAKGQNKVSFTLRNNLQVDVRLLPARQLRSRAAILHRLQASQRRTAPARDQARPHALRVRSAPPRRQHDHRRRNRRANLQRAGPRLHPARTARELRRDRGRRKTHAAATHRPLATSAATCTCTPSSPTARNSIREMAEAAIARGLEYIAITDHSKNLAMTNGMDDTRALAHAKRIREASAQLAEEFAAGRGPQWELYNAQLRQQDRAPDKSLAANPQFPSASSPASKSTSSSMARSTSKTTRSPNSMSSSPACTPASTKPAEEVTARVLRAAENPHVHILGHPTGRKVLKREPYKIDVEQTPHRCRDVSALPSSTTPHPHAPTSPICTCATPKNSAARSSATRTPTPPDELDLMAFGITQLRRAWLTASRRAQHPACR